MASTLDRLAYDAARLLGFVASVASADRGPRQLLATLGWDLPPGVEDVGLAALDLSALGTKVQAVEEALSSGADGAEVDRRFVELFIELQAALGHLGAAVSGLSAAGDYLDKTGIKAEFLPRLNGLLTVSRLGSASPWAFLVLQFFGVVSTRHYAADPGIYQLDHMRADFDWHALGRLFSDPVGLLEARYGWGTATFDGDGFVTNLSALVEAFGEPVRLRTLPRRVEEQLAGVSVPEADSQPATQLIASLLRGDEASGMDAGLSLFPLRASSPGAPDAGIAVCPYVHGAAQLKFPLTPRLALEFDSTVALDSGIALQFRPGRPVSLKAGLLGAGGVVDSLQGKALLRLLYAAPAGSRQTLLALPGGGLVEVESLSFAGGVEAAQGGLAPSFAARLTGGRAVLGGAGADSFLASVLPAGGVELKFDLGLRWSGAQGFSFEGSAAAEVDLPLHLSLAGLRIDGLHVGLRPAADDLAVELSLAGGFGLGPLAASFDRLGALATLAFHDGNLGPVDLSLAFKPPSGIGLAVEAHGVLTGGGFLFHDPAQHLYAGVLQLSLHERITLTAFGLVATRMPDGSPGYSLVVFITAEDFRPIPLGLGFTLQGIGGMVAVHRTFDAEVLRAGLKNDTLGSLLFPRDPVANAPAIVRALASAFPARRGSYLLGILARIGWFTPTLVQLDLALILEFGARKRLLVLGRISSLLPSRDNDLVRLNLDAMGVVDFDQGTAAIDAVLVDSRLVHKYALTGAMALRARWTAGPGSAFVLAVGGLNPHFAPPAGLPTLERIAIALSSGDNPRLTCEAYWALTANTVQFGARAQLHAAAYGFSVDGDIGYDVLLQIAPLHFLAEFHASVQLKRGSSNLFKVALAGALEGPRPLRVSGKASFEILWCDFSVRFDKTLIDGEPPPPPLAVDVLAELQRALATAQSWTTLRPAGQPHGVALRKLAAGTALVLDPLGRLAVKQQVVPLNTGRDIELFGGAPVAGARRFRLAATLSGQPQQAQPLRDSFAPAQFFDLSDDDKLAGPSFEEMDAGAVFGSQALAFDAAEVVGAPLQYEPIVLDALAQPHSAPPSPHSPTGPRYVLGALQLRHHSASGAAARSPLRRTGLARFRDPDAAPAASLNPPRWTLLPLADGAAAATAADVSTWSEYRAAQDRLNRGGARWQIVPGHELGAVA
jgi:hypothetical protein